MAPTLQDVSYLLGLPLAGEPIGPLDAPVGWHATMQARFAGVREGVQALPDRKNGPSVAWLGHYQVILLCYIFTYPCMVERLTYFSIFNIGREHGISRCTLE